MALFRRPTVFENVLGNSGSSGLIQFPAPSTSWWSSSATSLTFAILLRSRALTSGGRICTRETVTLADGTYIGLDATGGTGGLKCVVNRNTTDINYRTTNPVLVNGKWYWLVVVINTGGGTGAKIVFYVKPVDPTGGPLQVPAVTATAEGTGTVAHGTANPFRIMNGAGGTGGADWEIAFLGVSPGSWSQAAVAGWLAAIEAAGFHEQLFKGGIGAGFALGQSAAGGARFRFACFPGSIWAGSGCLDVAGGLVSSNSGTFKTGRWPSIIGGPAAGRWRAVGTGAAAQALSFTPPAVTVAAVDPGVVPGAASLSYTPAAVSVTVPDPSISTGGTPQSLSFTPAAVTVAVVTPALVAGAVSLAPTPAAVTVAAVAPSLVPGAAALAYTPAAVAVVAVTPAVTPGASSLTYTPAAVAVVAVTPAIGTGGGSPQSLSFTPAALTVTAATPTLVPGAVALSFAQAAVAVVAVTPSLAPGAVSLAAAAPVVACVAVAPAVVAVANLAPAPASVGVVAVAPGRVLGGVALSFTPASVAVVVQPPTVTGGLQIAFIQVTAATLTAATAILSALGVARAVVALFTPALAYAGLLQAPRADRAGLEPAATSNPHLED